MLCDYNIERYIRKNNYDFLNSLTPINRFVEKFRFETEALKLKFEPEDEIVGWYFFDMQCETDTVFDDEKIGNETNDIINATEEFYSSTNVDRGHTLVDYESILKNGLISYERQIDDELNKSMSNEYLSAMKNTISIIKSFLKRTVDIIDRKMYSGNISSEKLGDFKNMLCKVPYYPAENFKEAVQAVWIIHFLLPLAENAWYSISLGKFDEYMYPYYKKSLSNGMTRSEAKKILHNFYKLLNNYADGACLLNIGPNYNELSELIIECQKDFAMPAPILAARIDENVSDNIWNSLIDEKLFAMGQPTFYGEKACINALIQKGISPEEALNFSNNSCMGISIAGYEFNSMWGCVFSVSAAFEAAVNCGRLFVKEGINIPDIKKPDNIETLFYNFEVCSKYLLNICVNAYEKKAKISEKTLPDPFVSLLTNGCIEKHCDRISGAKYHNVTVECMGMVNVADGMFAVDKLVFKDKKYTLDELGNAVKNNFKGYENIRSDIINCGKFGENSEADGYAVRIAEILQNVIRGFDHDNFIFAPSLHTLDSNVWYGSCFGAGYDGRYSGTPFAKNAGPSNSARIAGSTSVVLSASKLPQYKFFGGQPIDVNFSADMVRNHKNEIKSLIKVYFERGGLQFQVNSLSSHILREAADNPEKYPNLVVRIGGYSIYFNKISRASKEEFIERFEKEGF